MKRYWTLFRKDIRTVINPTIFLIVLIGCMTGYRSVIHVQASYRIIEGEHPEKFLDLFQYEQYIHQFFVSVEFMLPILLVYLLYREWRFGSRYQILSLPVRRSPILLTKFLAIIGAGICILFTMLLYDGISSNLTNQMHYHNQIIHYPGRWMNSGSPPNSSWYELFRLLTQKYFWEMFFIRMVRYSVMLSGVVCFAWGVMSMVKRQRSVTFVASFYIGTAMNALLWSRVMRPLFSFPDTYYSLLYVLSSAIVFLAAGMVLYSKYEEI